MALGDKQAERVAEASLPRSTSVVNQHNLDVVYYILHVLVLTLGSLVLRRLLGNVLFGFLCNLGHSDLLLAVRECRALGSDPFDRLAAHATHFQVNGGCGRLDELPHLLYLKRLLHVEVGPCHLQGICARLGLEFVNDLFLFPRLGRVHLVERALVHFERLRCGRLNLQHDGAAWIEHQRFKVDGADFLQDLLGKCSLLGQRLQHVVDVL